jgi:hypothetical protein
MIDADSPYITSTVRGPTSCVGCGKGFSNTPGSEHPTGLQTKIEKNGRRVVVGDLCAACMDKPAKPEGEQ